MMRASMVAFNCIAPQCDQGASQLPTNSLQLLTGSQQLATGNVQRPIAASVLGL